MIAAFLAPIHVGGQLNTEATSLAPGGLMLFRSIFSGVDETISYFDKKYQPWQPSRPRLYLTPLLAC